MTTPVPIEMCDVADKERLAMFRYLRRQWIDILNGPDPHAICKQLTGLLAADLEFHTINHSRKLTEDAGVQQNGMIHWFIDRGFVAHQALTIRRVTEQFDGPKGRAVFSLPRIISEIESHRELFTREMYVCCDGDPYDVSRDFMHGYVKHSNFDELARTTEGSRSRDDIIHPDTFRDLKRRYKSSEVVRTFASKWLAHAADPTTRTGNEGIHFRELEAAYQDLIWLTNYISGSVLYDAGHTFLASYCVDMLDSIDQPVCPQDKVEDLRRYWDLRYHELDQIERAASEEQLS